MFNRFQGELQRGFINNLISTHKYLQENNRPCKKSARGQGTYSSMFLPQHESITVIDEQLILKAINDERYSESKNSSGVGNIAGTNSNLAGAGSKRDPMNRGREVRDDTKDPQDEPVILEEVEVLRLGYKNILTIDNLVGLTNLTTLCLDNNVIEHINGIDHLENLVWLDLSFNNISSINGLEKLTKLRDLSLFNNNISTIENLDGCKETLEVLSMGNNNISKLDNLLHLRQFKQLRLVNFEGNPVCSDPEYRSFVLAYLASLKYLDYALIDKAEVTTAGEQYQDELQELLEREALIEANRKSTENQAQYLDKLKRTNLFVVETLFDEIFKSDNEFQKFKMLPGMETIMESYQHEFRQQVESMITAGLELFEKANDETERFQAAVDNVMERNSTSSIKLIEEFSRHKKVLFRELRESDTERSQLQDRLDELGMERDRLGDTLLSIEMQQVEQLTALRDTFENRSTAVKAARLDRAQLFFRAVEDLENSWFTTTEELIQGLVDKVANNEPIEDANDEILAILSGKDALLVAVQTSHDIHLGKLLGQEDSMRESLLKAYNTLLTETKAEHTQANRNRVHEIQRLLQQVGVEINSFLAEEQIDDEDFA